LPLTPYSSKGWRSRLAVLVLVLAGGVLLGVFTRTALADEPVPTTVPTPTLPAPVPAPTPAPPPPPVKKPPPKKSAPPPRKATPTPSVSHAPAFVPRSPPVRTQAHTPKRTVHRVHRKIHKKIKRNRPATVAPVDKADQAVGASVGFLPTPPGSNSGGSFNLGGLFVILGCVLAIGCFAIALVPATAVPWRPVAGFISHRQLDLTLTGLTLLVAVLTFYFITGA
jgi:hypothetical protein